MEATDSLEVLWWKNSRREYKEVWSACTAPGSCDYIMEEFQVPKKAVNEEEEDG